jgi:hypothetical protein
VSGVLLDVNVLLSLAWPNHQHHASARQWFTSQGAAAWRTCGVSQLAFVRLSSNPAFTKHAVSPLEATLMLQRMTAHAGHLYIDALPPCTDASFESIAHRMQGHRQVTDAYLVAIARAAGVRLVTFDRRIASLSGEADVVIVL